MAKYRARFYFGANNAGPLVAEMASARSRVPPAAAGLVSRTLAVQRDTEMQNRKTKPKRPWGGRNASSPWEASRGAETYHLAT